MEKKILCLALIALMAFSQTYLYPVQTQPNTPAKVRITIYDTGPLARALAEFFRAKGYDVIMVSGREDIGVGYAYMEALIDWAETKMRKTITEDALWGLVRVIRGEKPNKKLLEWCRGLGISRIDKKTAHSILLLMDLFPDNDPQVIATKYGYINLRNSPWKMEHWLTRLSQYDENMNKIADRLEKILQKEEQEIPVRVAAADARLREAMDIFRSMGGRIEHVWEKINAFWGYIDPSKIPVLASKEYIGYIEYHYTNYTLYLRVSIPQQRFGTNANKYMNNIPYNETTPWGQGYLGDPYSTLLIVDTGLDDTHPELGPYQDQGFGSAKIVYWRDISNTYPTSPGDGHGHGSHCAGIAAGQGNPNDPWGPNAHMGAAPKVSIGGIKIFDDNGYFVDSNFQFADYEQNDRATYHFIVASNSWGGGDDATLNEIMNNLVSSGIVEVVAAGNSGANANIGSPGSADLVITVGAINDRNRMAEYSTTGDTTTGNTVKPDVTANGGSSWYVGDTFCPDDEDGNGYTGQVGSVDSNDAQNTAGDDNYVDWPGTSMATPHVSGLAALIIDAMGGWSAWPATLEAALKVKMIILMTAVEFTRRESTSQLLPSLDRGGKDNVEGYGRINADAAIMALKNTLSLDTTYTYTLGSSSTDDADQAAAPRAWAGHIYMSAGTTYRITLDVPDGADFDVYVYAPNPDAYGQPILVAAGTSSMIGGDEIVEFTPSESGDYYVVVKWIDRSQTDPSIPDYQNYGTFSLTITELGAGYPIVNIVEPEDGSTVKGIVKIKVNATDTDGTISSVVLDIFNDTWSTTIDITGYYNSTSGLYEYPWNTTTVSDGWYSIKAEATDNDGKTSSDQISVFVRNRIPPIILVDDDAGGNYETYYESALQALGYSRDVDYLYWNRDTDGLPTQDILAETKVMIWFTGDDYSTTLTQEDRDLIAWYLDSGKALFISGQDIGYDIYSDDPEWFQNYLKAIYENDDANIDTVNGTGLVGSVFENISFNLADGDGADNNNWPSEIAPTGGSITALYYGTDPSIGAAVQYDGTFRLVYFAFPFEAINNADDREKCMRRVITFLLGVPPILLVDDDAGASYETYYELALQELGYVKDTGYVRWDRDKHGIPPRYILNKTQIVIWFTGDDYTTTLVQEDRDLIAWYLDSGKALFISGQDIGYDIYNDDPTWFQTYLKATYEADDTNIDSVTGEIGSIFEGITYYLSDGDGASNNNYPSDIAPTGGSILALYYGTDPSLGAAIQYDDAFRLVYFAFPFEAINTADDRRDCMQRILEFLYGGGDTVPPTVNITSPSDGEYLNTSDVTVTWTGSDNVGIDHYEVRIDGGTWIDVGLSTSYTFTGLSEGSHTVDVRAFDQAGNIGSDSVTFTVDITPPSVNITSPSDGEYVNTTDVTITWSGDDNIGIDHYEVRIDDGSWIDVGSSTSYTFTGLSEGSHVVDVKVIDRAGNIDMDSVSFTVDITAPTVQITSPSDGDIIGSSNVTVTWSGSDNYGIDHYEVRIDGGSWINVGTSTEYTFTDLSEGNHTVDVRAFDFAGNIGSDSVTFTVQLEALSVQIISPPNGSYIGTQDVEVVWSGSGSIDHYEVRIDGGSWINVGTNTSYTFTGLSEGSHTVDVQVIGTGGEVAMDSVTFIVDVTSPSITLISPSNESYINQRDITVEWSGSDNYGIDHYEVRIDGGSWINVDGYTSYTFRNLAEGQHIVDIRAIDYAGNIGECRLVFTIDISSPMVSILSPEEGSYIGEQDVTVTWEGDDNIGIDHYEIRIDGGSWINVGTDTNYTFTGLSEGSHVVDVRVYDYAGNVGEDSVSFTVDLNPPSVSITSPTDEEYLNVRDVTVEWVGSDSIGIAYYEVRVDGGSWINVGLETRYVCKNLVEGRHLVEVRAVDHVGNIATDSVRFTVDISAPAVRILSPPNDTYIGSSNVTVTWSGADNIGVDHYEVRIDGGSWIDVGNATSYEFMGLSEGEHRVEVRAYDYAGNVGSTSVVFYVDLSPPTVSILSPSNGTYFNVRDITVEWNGSDSVGIDYYEVRIDGGSWINVGTSTSYTFTNVEEGYHIVEVRAVDHVGNIDKDSVEFTVDISPPLVNINFPLNNSYIGNSTVNVTWDANDNTGIDHYEVRIDGGSWINVGTDTAYTFTGLSEGKHYVDVKAVDLAGNEGISRVVFTVDLSPPYVGISQPMEGEYLATRNVTIEWSGGDSIGIDHYEIRIDGGSWINVGTQTQYTFINLEEGDHVVEVRAVDKVGRYDEDSVTFTVDISAPHVDITNPLDGGYEDKPSVVATWEGSDNTGIDYYEVRIDGGSWINVGTNTSYTFTGLSEGQHTIDVRAFDYAGNSAMDSTTFTVDLFEPTLGILSPANESYIGSRNVTIVWSGNDSIGVDHYEVRIDGGSWINVDLSTNYTFENLLEGEHRVEVRVFDHVGRMDEGLVIFTVDISNPWVDIKSPPNGTYIGSPDVTVKWEANDNCGIDHFLIRMDNESWINVGIATNYTFRNLTEGIHRVYVRAVDYAGNYAEDSVVFIISFEFYVTIEYPEEGSYINSTKVTVVWTATNISDISYFEIRVDLGNWTSVGMVTNYTITGLGEGEHTVEVRAVYSGGYTATASTTFIVDLTPPDIWIITPQNNTCVGVSNITIVWNASDNYGIGYYMVGIDSKEWVNISESTTYTFENLSDGVHTICVKAVDLAGNTNSKVILIVVDLLPPEITIISPGNGSYVNREYVLATWNATDAGGIDHFEIKLGNGPWEDVGRATSYVFAIPAEGEYTIYVKAVDIFGHEKIASVRVTVDLTPPTITIVSPKPNEVIGATSITVEWEATDNYGIAYYEIRVDMGEWIELNTTTYELKDLSEGRHFVEVMAVDLAGNQGAAGVSFEVSPKRATKTPLIISAIAATVVAAISLVVFLMWWRRKRKREGVGMEELVEEPVELPEEEEFLES